MCAPAPRRIRVGWPLLCLLAAACTDGSAGLDAGPPDAGADAAPREAGGDAGADVGPDMAWPDLPGPDSYSPPDSVAAFKGDMAAGCRYTSLNPVVLHPHYCVVYRDTLGPINSSPIKEVIALAYRANQLWILYFGQSFYSATIAHWPVDPKSGALGQVSTGGGVSTYNNRVAGNYLPLSPAGYLALGYYSIPSLEGELSWGPFSYSFTFSKQLSGVKACSDVVYLDDSSLLISAAGVGTVKSGQGVYHYKHGETPVLVIKDVGSAGGQLALGKNTLYVGGYHASSNSHRIFGFSLAEVKAVLGGQATLNGSTSGDLIHVGHVRDATVLGDDLVLSASDSSFSFSAVRRVPVTVNGNSLKPGTPVDLVARGRDSTMVPRLSASGTELGLLVTDGTRHQLAVIQHR
jgi:hypothetical protein